MCGVKIDWTKPIETNVSGEWEPAELLWHDDRWPDEALITWGQKYAVEMVECGEIRNAPPPPPEVWIVWERHGDEWEATGMYAVEQKILEQWHQQKVVCDAPLR